MAKGATELKRCTECRGWYHPAPSAAKTQRVCGQAACQRARKRKQGRRRRSARLQDHRADERDRQRECRKRKRAEVCHAPPSDGKAALLAAGMLETVDEVMGDLAALSRATLQRRISRLARLWAAETRTETGS
jgi:hypothetical protein